MLDVKKSNGLGRLSLLVREIEFRALSAYLSTMREEMQKKVHRI
jgi:hypothetical protein